VKGPDDAPPDDGVCGDIHVSAFDSNAADIVKKRGGGQLKHLPLAEPSRSSSEKGGVAFNTPGVTGGKSLRVPGFHRFHEAPRRAKEPFSPIAMRGRAREPRPGEKPSKAGHAGFSPPDLRLDMVGGAPVSKEQVSPGACPVDHLAELGGRKRGGENIESARSNRAESLRAADGVVVSDEDRRYGGIHQGHPSGQRLAFPFGPGFGHDEVVSGSGFHAVDDVQEVVGFFDAETVFHEHGRRPKPGTTVRVDDEHTGQVQARYHNGVIGWTRTKG
jgi:hypothetical protein